jgi:hypothetical protein
MSKPLHTGGDPVRASQRRSRRPQKRSKDTTPAYRARPTETNAPTRKAIREAKSSFAPGDHARLMSHYTGEILSIDGDIATVLIGIARWHLPLAALTRA